MLIVITIAAAASLAVIAYTKLREHSPEAGTAGLRAVRELAAIVLVCSKAIEGVVDVLAGGPRQATQYGYADTFEYGSSHEPDVVTDTVLPCPPRTEQCRHRRGRRDAAEREEQGR